MLAVSVLNIISSLISRALSDDIISDEEYSQILLEFEAFSQMKEDLRIKSKTSLEKTDNIEIEANEFLRANKIVVRLEFQNRVQIRVQNRIQNRVLNCVQNRVRK